MATTVMQKEKRQLTTVHLIEKLKLEISMVGQIQCPVWILGDPGRDARLSQAPSFSELELYPLPSRILQPPSLSSTHFRQGRTDTMPSVDSDRVLLEISKGKVGAMPPWDRDNSLTERSNPRGHNSEYKSLRYVIHSFILILEREFPNFIVLGFVPCTK
ncbi:hypothetical protein RRG08_024852 [Elysia crispata]|uniref:Uncharacterized protein n=1 Tax=Elysia crispata TaxID=231223 RepID=A0AAE0YJJ1_9GAST|nr:hypothetical protein RRG08_024852 [Elysia crispata]